MGLRDKSLLFQCHRSYPKGLPSFFRDYVYKQDEASSDDSDFSADSSQKHNKLQRQSILTQKLTNQFGFKRERVKQVIMEHPNASYEKILEILTNIKSKNMPKTHPKTSKVSLSEDAFHRRYPQKTKLSPSIHSVSVDSDGYTKSDDGFDAVMTPPNYISHKRAKTPPPAQYKKPKLPPTNNKNMQLLEGNEGYNEQESDDEELSVVYNEDENDEIAAISSPKLPPKMIKSRSFKRYKTVSLGLNKKTKSMPKNDAICNAKRGRARSKSIDDRDGNIRRKRVHKTPPPPPRPQATKRPKKYSMNDVDDDMPSTFNQSNHYKRSQTIDLKQYIAPNDMSNFTKSVRISDELFSRRKKKKSKQNEKKLKKKQIPK